MYQNNGNSISADPNAIENPTVYLDDRYLPDMEGWTVGEEHEVMVVLRQKTVHQSQTGTGATRTSGEFEIVSMTCMDETDKDPREMTEKEFTKTLSKMKRKYFSQK